MPRTLVITRRFDRSYGKRTPLERQSVDLALQSFADDIRTGHAALGFGIKQLHPGIYEFRVGLALRVVYVIEGSTIYLTLVGRHDDVQRFLKSQ